LHICPQEAWSAFHSIVSRQLGLPVELMFYCGLALGYAAMEHPVNKWRTSRAGVAEFAKLNGIERSEGSQTA